MCLSTVYDLNKPDSVIMEYVSRIETNGQEIILTDIMGERKSITGTLISADLTGGVVKIQVA